ncbi:MAG: hypothetical protein J6Y86_00590 [Pseudobutyrivibrio sp.]|nr:hypothetical protein [Pseudobutyrivibrio sp.]
MEKPVLYRYKFYEDTGEIESEAIEDYREMTWYGKTEYRYRLLGSIRIVKECNIDKYIYEQVHSFNPDIKHAKQIIRDSVKTKYLKASKDAERCRKILDKIK